MREGNLDGEGRRLVAMIQVGAEVVIASLISRQPPA
jgi:hypothetical protein